MKTDNEKLDLHEDLGESKNDTPFNATDNNKSKPFLSGWRWAWGILLASFLAWVPFFGYTHLLQMLETAGFRGAYINPKTYDLVYYFMMGWSEVVNNGFPLIETDKIIDLSLKILGFALFAGTVLTVIFWWVISLAKRNKAGIENSEKRDIYYDMSKILVESTESLKGFSLLWLAMILLLFSTAMLEVVALISLFILSSFLWFLSLTGYLSGIAAGKEVVISTECRQREPSKSEINDKFRVGCSLMNIEGKEVQGIRIYSDEKHIFFLGDDGAYQTDYQGNLVLFSPIERLKSEEDKGNTEGAEK